MVKCLVLISYQPTTSHQIRLIELTEQEEHPQLEQSPEQEQVWQLLSGSVSMDIMVLALDPDGSATVHSLSRKTLDDWRRRTRETC